jgi:hypothetical protein
VFTTQRRASELSGGVQSFNDGLPNINDGALSTDDGFPNINEDTLTIINEAKMLRCLAANGFCAVLTRSKRCCNLPALASAWS